MSSDMLVYIQAVDLTLARGFFSPGTTLSVGRDLKNMIC